MITMHFSTSIQKIWASALLCGLFLTLTPISSVSQTNRKRKTKAAPARAESIAAPTPPHDANADTNGDGKTDFLIARAAGNATALSSDEGTRTPINRGARSIRERQRIDRTQPTSDSLGSIGIQWWAAQTETNVLIGQVGDSATDFVVIEDFDGDGKDDYAVWRPGPPNSAKFIILESTTNTFREEIFGQTGDDPAVTGDYDGDGKADLATFRCPSDSPGQCYFFYRGSLNNPEGKITYVPWGFGADGDLYANPGDYDGDGKYDFVVQRTVPGTTNVGQFVVLRSSDLGIEFVTWGNSTDFMIPGDYDGDGRFDFCVRQVMDGRIYHWVLTRNGTIIIRQFGQDGDLNAPGDYDGDGKQDFAIWREDPLDETNNHFWVLRSSDNAIITYKWGLGFDYPAANWYVH